MAPESKGLSNVVIGILVVAGISMIGLLAWVAFPILDKALGVWAATAAVTAFFGISILAARLGLKNQDDNDDSEDEVGEDEN